MEAPCERAANHTNTKSCAIMVVVYTHTNNTCETAHELLCDTESAVCGCTHIRCDPGNIDVTVCMECAASSPPKHSLDLVSWSDLPVCTKRLYQPAFRVLASSLWATTFLFRVAQDRQVLRAVHANVHGRRMHHMGMCAHCIMCENADGGSGCAVRHLLPPEHIRRMPPLGYTWSLTHTPF